MTVQQVIRTVYEDGSVVLSNIRNNKGFPIFKENETVSATKVTKWYDDTDMDNSKVDGKVYLRSKELNEYYLLNLPNHGKDYLEKDTMLDLRNISSIDLLLIKMGYYKGIRLNGYSNIIRYNDSIIYTWDKDNISQDDGGSIIDLDVLGTTIGRFITRFREANVLYFGAINNSGRYFVNYDKSSNIITSKSPIFSNYNIGTTIRLEHVLDTTTRYAQDNTIKNILNDGRSIELNTSLTEFLTSVEGAILFTNIEDSGAAIQNCGDYAVKNSVSMYIPKGGYYLTKSFQIEGTGGYLDDDQRCKLYLEGTGAEIYFGSNLSYGGPSLSVMGFTQISDLSLNGISFKGWQNNKKWFNYSNADNAPTVKQSSPLFRIMGFDNLRITNCNFEDNAGSIAIMGKDQPFGRVDEGVKVTSGGLYFHNNRVSNWWQFSMTRGRGKDFIISNNTFEYLVHKMYSVIDNACNHIYTGNIFRKCGRILFGINDGLIFTDNILDTVLLGIKIRGFSHPNYTDYGRKNILISNNIFNTTDGGLSTKEDVSDYTSIDIKQAGKNIIHFDMSNDEYGGSGIPKIKGVRFTNNICDMYDSVSPGDALFTYSIGKFEIEDLVIKGNTITTNTMHSSSKNRWVQTPPGDNVKITRILDFSDNIIKGTRSGYIGFDFQESLSGVDCVLRINNNLFEDKEFNQILFSAVKVRNLIANNNTYIKGDNLSTNVAVYQMISPKKDINIKGDTVIKPNNNANGGHLIITQLVNGDSNGIIVKVNNCRLGSLANVIQDISTYTTGSDGFLEAINNICTGGAIANNASSRVNNLLNPMYDLGNNPKDLPFIPHGYIIYLRVGAQGDAGRWGYLKTTTGWIQLTN